MSKTSTARTRPSVATTVRLDPGLHEGLELLREALARPVNKMINEAVREFLAVRTARTQHELAGMAARLEQYRRRDPGFKQAMARSVESEAALGAEDPAEGRRLAVDAPAAAGSSRARVRALLKP